MLRQSPKKRNLDQNINDSKSHICNSFFEHIISAIHRFYICSEVPMDIIRVFFNFRFSIRKSQSQQKLAKKITHFTTISLKKNSLILRTSTHSTLKVICSRNTAKILPDLTNFLANMFLFGVRKKYLHCTIS